MQLTAKNSNGKSQIKEYEISIHIVYLSRVKWS